MATATFLLDKVVGVFRNNDTRYVNTNIDILSLIINFITLLSAL